MIECSTAEAQKHIQEIRRCSRDFKRFVSRYCQVYSAADAEWIPFHLWPAQEAVADILQAHPLVILLKARQIGMTWLVVAFSLWLMLFRPAATILLFSRRDDEAVDLLKTRLRGMYDRLPELFKAASLSVDNDHEWGLSNGSRVLAFPTTAGDSYTATLAVVDEADLLPDLDRLMRSVKPTIDNGGRMILLSRSDKSKPQSSFKRMYAAAKEGRTAWKPVFLPWHAHPGRDAAWRQTQATDILSRTGSLDDLHEQYPEVDTDALAPRTLDKRIAPDWLRQCYIPQDPLAALPPGAPAIPGLAVYAPPVKGRRYVVAVDPAEGNPTSDDSALEVLDYDSGEEVASLAGKFQPSVIAAHADSLGKWYNRAGLMVERNNHGHAVLLWLRDNSPLRRFTGHDVAEGWLSSTKGKALLYDAAADAFRNGDTLLHSFATFTQLASIEGATLRAPTGERDDRADAYAIGLATRVHVKLVGDFQITLPPKGTTGTVLDALPKGVFRT